MRDKMKRRARARERPPACAPIAGGKSPPNSCRFSAPVSIRRAEATAGARDRPHHLTSEQLVSERRAQIGRCARVGGARRLDSFDAFARARFATLTCAPAAARADQVSEAAIETLAAVAQCGLERRRFAGQSTRKRWRASASERSLFECPKQRDRS